MKALSTRDELLPRKFQVHLRNKQITIITRRGIPDWDHITPAEEIIAENTSLQHGARVVIYGCHHGAIPARLGIDSVHKELILVDHNWQQLRLAEYTLQENKVPNYIIVEHPESSAAQPGTIDLAIILMPKGRSLTRKWLLEAFNALRISGRCLLAGPNNLGIQSSIHDADELFGNHTILAYRHGNRLASMTKRDVATSVDWISQPGIKSGTWAQLFLPEYPHYSPLNYLPGVFSANSLDEGTHLLMQTVAIHKGAASLDLGCGMGILGIHASSLGAGSVDCVDVNLLAVASARHNLARFSSGAVSAIPGDGASQLKDKNYDVILTNPPFHAGRTVDLSITSNFILEGWRVLANGGEFWLVCNSFIRYDNILKEIFGSAQIIAQNNRYQVWHTRKQQGKTAVL